MNKLTAWQTAAQTKRLDNIDGAIGTVNQINGNFPECVGLSEGAAVGSISWLGQDEQRIRTMAIGELGGGEEEEDDRINVSPSETLYAD